ncbi:MAG: type II secretion system minor pseudopilin GspK [Kordiimonadaceae bacterium]|nr:type II secretion system minor pseudopilin GspK [Kordiimonadaceae bacterium]
MIKLVRKFSKDDGAILITVMLTVAIMSVVAVTILEQVGYSIRVSANAEASNQARWYALSTEDWAQSQLQALRLDNSDDRQEQEGGSSGFVGARTSLLIGDMRVNSSLRPLRNCFNLNSLVSDSETGKDATNKVALAQFERLMKGLDISGYVAERVAASTADWIDPDSETQPYGAEDYDYSGQVIPHRTGNVPMADVSELRAIKGVTPALYRQIRPFVCTLPNNKISKINLNTLTSQEAPLIDMLFEEDAIGSAAEAIISARPIGGFSDLQQLLSIPGLAQFDVDTKGKENFTLKAQYFVMTTTVEAKRAYIELRSFFDIDGGAEASLIHRHFGDET